MRKLCVTTACLVLAFAVSGCDPNDRGYFREGIGTDLYTTSSLEVADLQNIYLDALCRQSLSYVGPGVPSCSGGQLPATAWPLIVQAGMNDIDVRCDSYLSWLDQRKRDNAAILSEIGAVRVAVDALTNPAVATGISPIALASVAAAFGLATNTLSNVNSLLLQVDHTTVQSVVFVNRREFREKMLKLAVSNKPMVIHALRSYLEICMPMTISANINSTVTVFQQSGVMERQPLVSTSTIAGVPFTPASVTQNPPRLPRVPPDADVAPFFAESDNLSRAETEFTLDGLCINNNTGTGLSRKSLIKNLVAIYEATPNPDNPPTPDGIISRNERLVINKQPNCNAAKNYFEKVTFANTQSTAKTKNSADNLAIFITGLLNHSPAGGELAGTTPLDSQGLRDKIRAVRTDLGLTDVPSQFNDQATAALIEKLKKPKSN
jgi:hypothetical protein